MKILRSRLGFAPLAILGIIGVVVVGGVGVSAASDSSKPGDTLYGVDRATESLQVVLSKVMNEEANFQLSLAAERLSELEALQNTGAAQENIEAAAALYEDHLSEALAKAEEARAQGRDTQEVSELITENTLRHQATLTDVYEQVPDGAKPAIQNAQEVSVKGFEESSSAISGKKLNEIVEKVKADIPTIEDKIPSDIKDKIMMPTSPVETP